MARSITYPNRKEWLASRQKGIGSSDAAAILGASKWGTPLSVWAEKVGRSDPEPDNRFTKAGTYLEAPVAQWFVDETGVELHKGVEAPAVETWVSEQWPMLRATPDFWVSLSGSKASELKVFCHDGNGQKIAPPGRGILEIKTTAAWLASDWDDGPPLYYQVQVQHQMLVLGIRWAFIAVLIGGNDMRWFFVERNEAFCKVLHERLQTFWETYVERDVQPPVERGSDAQIIKELFPGHTEGVQIDLDGQWIDLDEQLERAKKSEKDSKEEVARLKAKFVQAIGGAESALLPNGVIYTNKKQTRKAYTRTVPESTTRVLRRKAPRKSK